MSRAAARQLDGALPIWIAGSVRASRLAAGSEVRQSSRLSQTRWLSSCPACLEEARRSRSTKAKGTTLRLEDLPKRAGEKARDTLREEEPSAISEVQVSSSRASTIPSETLEPLAGPSNPRTKGMSTSEASSSFVEASLPTADIAVEGMIGCLTPPRKRRSKEKATSSIDLTNNENEVDEDVATGSDPIMISVEETKPELGMSLQETTEYRQAVAAGKLPDTELSKTVFKNWKRFPGCDVFTRVGKFYESYYEPAFELSDLLGLKIARKRGQVGLRDKGKKKVKESDKQYALFPMCGFPFHQLDKYLKILVHDMGRTVVLVEESDHITDGQIVLSAGKDRRVGRIVTPGTLVSESWIKGSESRYLLAISISSQSPDASSEGVDGQSGKGSLAISLAYTDASTGEFFSKESTVAQLEDELARIAPSEVVLDEEFRSLWQSDSTSSGNDCQGSVVEALSLLRVLGYHISFTNTFFGPPEEDSNGVMIQLPSAPTPVELTKLSLEGQAISLLRHHLQFALREGMPSMAKPDKQVDSAYMHIDAATLQALEIRQSIRSTGSTAGVQGSHLSRQGTLVSVLDQTVTDAGHRLLVRTLTSPSTSLPMINERQALVQAFVEREDLREDLQGIMKNSKDIMRLLQRFRGKGGDADDMWATAMWISMCERALDRLKSEIAVEISDQAKKCNGSSVNPTSSLDRLQRILDAWIPLKELRVSIEKSVDEEWLNRDGRRAQEEDMEEEEESMDDIVLLDKGQKSKKDTRQAEEDRESSEEVHFWLKPDSSPALKRHYDHLEEIRREKEKLQEKLQKVHGDKVWLRKFSKYGYYIDATSPQIANQVVAKSPRSFAKLGEKGKALSYTPWTVLGSQRDETLSKISEMQNQQFRNIRSQIVDNDEAIESNSRLMNELDLAMCFAQTASEMAFVRPTMTDGTDFSIINGRHPTVEAALNSSIRPFTPNSTVMNPGQHLHIITGPNQGGKSTLLRQTAILAILAQSGSFVPADQATIGIVDKVFSRIGSRDELYRDRSTFMLEMVETASILRYATDRSLVIMDEIGRGTTLQAGISIAYATLEYILSKIKCRTLFATHYHELGRMLGGKDNRHNEVAAMERTAGDSEAALRQGVEFWCTDVDETDGAFSYSYKLKPGLNFNSHAIKAATIAGMPPAFLQVASDKLEELKRAELKAGAVLASREYGAPPEASGGREIELNEMQKSHDESGNLLRHVVEDGEAEEDNKGRRSTFTREDQERLQRAVREHEEEYHETERIYAAAHR